MKLDRNRIFSFMLAAAFALTLAGCGGGGGTAQMPDTMPDPQMECEGAGGRYNADMTCTSAEELLMERQAAQRSAINTAIDAAGNAVAAVNDDSTDAEVMAANAAIEAANAAIANAADVPAEEMAAHSGAVSEIAGRLSAALESRMAAMDAADEAARMAMMATAMKLHAGIGAPVAGTGADALNAAYSGANIAVQIGTAAAAVNLTENKDATVADHYGWQGQMFTASPAGGGTYEAVVYSNVGEPTEGAKFNVEYTDLDATTGERPIDTSAAGVPALVASPSFDQSAGTKAFELPNDNTVRVIIPGSFHGVSGMYYCTPTGGGTNCSAAVATGGFTLAGGTWTFKPTDPEARLMDMPDETYASYGWWIHKSANGETFTASAFAADRGTVDAASGLDTLEGTATYMGGAAGKYALRSLTGGTNDAGHFTARATLEADFTDNMVTGTIDNFMGADGQPRNWSVELKDSGVSADGTILGENGTGEQMQTVWTMDGTAADAAGGWQGTLKDNGDDLVPKVGTGTFYSEFGTAGKMVGGFGVNKQ